MRLIKFALAVLLVSAIVSALAPEAGAEKKITTSIQRTSTVAELFAGAPAEAVITPDFAHLAWIADNDGRKTVYFDGRTDDSSHVNIAQLVLSDDGAHCTYVGSSGGMMAKTTPVVDGKEGGIYRAIRRLVLNADGSLCAFCGFGKSGAAIVVNGTPVEGYSFVDGTHLALSPDGRKIAFIAMKEAGRCVVTLEDGEKTESETAGHIEPLSLKFSPDSKKLAYAGSIGGRGGPMTVFAGAESVEISGRLGMGPSGCIFWSDDSEHYAFYAIVAGKMTAFVDGRAIEHELGAKAPVFSPDATKVALVMGGMVSDEKPGIYDMATAKIEVGKLYFHMSGFQWSADSKHWAHVARFDGGKRSSYAVDGNDLAKYEGVQYGRFSPDGTKFAYLAWKGSEGGRTFYVVVADTADGKYEILKGCPLPGAPVFSPGSKYVAYPAGEEGKAYVAVNGTPGETFDNIVRQKGKSILWTSDNTFTYFAARDGKVYKVEEKVE